MSEYEAAIARPDTAVRRWAIVRLALGIAQMTGASTGAVLVVLTGVTPWSLGVAAAVTALTVFSIRLFARRSG
jgi:hypothetical protein